MSGSSGPGPADSAPQAPSADALELYKAVRAHELMLNQAASAYEHAVVIRLAALNGGAASVFLTLLGVLLKSDGSQNVEVPFAAAAIVVWSIGLLVASYAAWHGLRQQRSLNKAHRIMREGLEHYLWPQLAPFARPPDPARPEVSIESADGEVDRRQNLIDGLGPRLALRTQSAGHGRWFDRTVLPSVACFTVGMLLALVAVIA